MRGSVRKYQSDDDDDQHPWVCWGFFLRVLCSVQEKRLRLDLDESVGRVRARAEGLGKSLEQAKGELVSLLNAKVWCLLRGLRYTLLSAVLLDVDQTNLQAYSPRRSRRLHYLPDYV